MGDSGETVNASHARETTCCWPCPRLFPSFTVNAGQMALFYAVRHKVRRDEYLPDAYRKPGKAEPYRGIVADTKAYAMNVPEKEPSDEERIAWAISRYGSCVAKMHKASGKLVEVYRSVTEAAKRNGRSTATLRRQIAEGFSPKSLYVFEIHGKEE